MKAPHPAGRPADRISDDTSSTRGNAPQATSTVSSSSEHLATTSQPRGRVGRLREKLGERDMAVLVSLARLRLLTGGQIQRLHVADGSLTTRSRRTRAVLQRLAELRLVVRLDRRIGGVRAGSSGFLYGISGHGQAVLTAEGLHSGRHRRVWTTSPAFADHVLAVADVYISLVEAERRGEIELLEFLAEPACWRRFPGRTGEAVTLKPDAFALIAIGDYEYSSFLEVDRGTESPSVIALKLATYTAYWQSGIEQAQHDVFPAVVWLTTGERRAVQLRHVVKRLPTDAQSLFQVALLGQVLDVVGPEAGGDL
jgi:hypothetical protein